MPGRTSPDASSGGSDAKKTIEWHETKSPNPITFQTSTMRCIWCRGPHTGRYDNRCAKCHWFRHCNDDNIVESRKQEEHHLKAYLQQKFVNFKNQIEVLFDEPSKQLYVRMRLGRVLIYIDRHERTEYPIDSKRRPEVILHWNTEGAFTNKAPKRPRPKPAEGVFESRMEEVIKWIEYYGKDHIPTEAVTRQEVGFQ